MRILVTGAAGFIGSHFVRNVLEGSYSGWEDAQVTALDKLTYAGNRDNLPGSHERLLFVRGDVCDRELLRELVPGHDAVVHFAAETHVDRSLEGAGDFFRTNVLGTQTLLDAVLDSGVERVVHVSTDEVYGSIDEGSWTEEWPLAPNSPYAASKAGSDLVARAYWRSHGVDLSITRCSNNYGPYQHPEKLIPLFVTNLLEGRRVPLYGEGANVREWLHVDDHCRGIHLVLNQGRAGEVYNIGGGNERTNLAITEQLLELTGAGAEAIQRVPDRKAHDLRYSIEETKIRDELGYAPRIGFEQGLADTVAWYRDNPDWWKAAKHGTDRAVA
ncbi:dTDP-glucose 4,6-dehydratase [Streptomyces phaeochromogenes]|jgi:dTDP-glucose 4,6-dehydratase|uniref:dTDP-glucose 4,6-dehydratase n=1 Tax=Streptomyces TaxID=1883 RepID=UPI00117E0B8D|nr:MULTISPECIES: dTDP-glucose 4,6-dehydratase [Streptomyces]MDQ0948226.1 dTDP-glucose 4,6-dehydratase [Streptomyces phaeochromogenes]TRO56987.1 dTDP-glucose 4,6-dehydratase [Streptomyces sp. IB201691-2A2]